MMGVRQLKKAKERKPYWESRGPCYRRRLCKAVRECSGSIWRGLSRKTASECAAYFWCVTSGDVYFVAGLIEEARRLRPDIREEADRHEVPNVL